MSESQNQPFQLSFNRFLRVDFQGSRVTSDGGLLVVRELDERLGLTGLTAELPNELHLPLNCGHGDPRLTPEGGGHMVLHDDKVEIGNSGLNQLVGYFNEEKINLSPVFRVNNE